MKPWQNDPFFQYPQTAVSASEGEVDLPILYFDDSNLMALFRVDYDKAQAMVAPHGLRAVRFAGGKALAGVAFYEYRETSIADYREAGVAIAVVPDGAAMPALPLLSLFSHPDVSNAGFYILDLPVTTAAACAAGREIWGYPKFITPIGFSLQGNRFEGTITDPDSGDIMVKLSGNAGLGTPGPLLDLILYSRRDDAMLRTLVNTRGGGRICLPGTIRLEVAGSHPMAQRLVALGLKNARPACVLHTHALQLRLNAGAVLP
ncbi:acetoacetate decarboxylase family protein [Noviherbaspirillum sp. UKPF54]|uniref:acetoacetate decarboxylase family protein n=1 Tax=Noviherbaspirillum sp. UKPF54 TaxID=2601898 RepID=UPI0011B103F9|nr:acetoacetate decarboxylase family protein [Noviherbaspirillum sp. UKPF54]QDZ29588.1 hypothetical protein FAY22_17440 [Noviherbaspirillum sp. UKPF54]